MKCLDACHEPPFSGSWETKWWCIHAKSMSAWVGEGKHYQDGRSINWLRLCEKTGKVVVHNKKCDVDPSLFRIKDDK